jgi:putative component of membrane protein insertase Oxa1/YidC/SpoIIIJ protein YidD
MLSWLFKKTIELYWSKIPENKRKVCIYKVSCSNFVYHKLENEGFLSGLSSYLNRYKNCKPDYVIELNDDKKVMIRTKKGNLLSENEINPLIVVEFKT